MGFKQLAKKIYHIYPYTTSNICNKLLFRLKGVRFGRKIKTRGVIYVVVSPRKTGFVRIGDSVTINSSLKSDPVTNARTTVLYAFHGGKIDIGDRVGISNSVIASFSSVRIDEDVMVGADCRIWDTDFHSSIFTERIHGNAGIKSKPVWIQRGAFIGAGSTVLKGVTIGEEAVVGTGSVVTCDIPPREIWGGNPAKFIGIIKED